MTVLGLKMSRYRNAVSHIHGRVTRGMWQEVWPNREPECVPIGHITNGVHVGTWLAPEMDRLYRRWLGEDWEQAMHDPSNWERSTTVDPEELWELNEMLRQRVLDYVRDLVRRQFAARGEKDPAAANGVPLLDDAALTICAARRFVRYKRPDLLLMRRRPARRAGQQPRAPGAADLRRQGAPARRRGQASHPENPRGQSQPALRRQAGVRRGLRHGAGAPPRAGRRTCGSTRRAGRWKRAERAA